MKVGTKSLLFGVHQFLWHAHTVELAWRALYGAPTFREQLCILIHDWGYWGSPEMDGEIGSKHPHRSAMIALRWLGVEEYNLVLFHSRHLAFALGYEPSKLCWADKYSMLYDPDWFYLLRARLSGEISEYRANAAQAGFIGLEASDRQWLVKLKAYLSAMSLKAAQPDVQF